MSNPSRFAVVYVRRSKPSEIEDERSRSVQEQETECVAFCERQRIGVAEVLVDDGRSASRYAKKQRPEFKRLLRMIEAGTVTEIVAWSLDRLVRQPKELEALIDLADRGLLTVHNLGGGQVDLSTSDGRMTARVLVAVAARESDELSRRVRRAKEARARAGRHSRENGHAPFGWLDANTPHPVEAPLIAEAVDGLLAGQVSLGSVMRSWNTRGHLSRRGREWSRVTVKACVLSPRHAGLAVHRGEIIDDAPWPSFVSPDKRAALDVMLNAPERFRPRAGRSWTTGLVFATDGTPMRRSKLRGQSIYRTADGRVQINGDKLDAIVLEAMFRAIEEGSTPTPSKLDARKVAKLRDELAAIDDRMAELGRKHARGKVSDAIVEAASDEARIMRAEIAAKLGTATTSAAAGPWVGRVDALREGWDDLDRSDANALAREVLGRVLVAPSTRGGGPFDADRIDIDWP